MTHPVPCSYCGGPMDPSSPLVWRLVVGWERKATAQSRKSGSDIVLRQPREKYACDGCIGRMRMGLSPGQQGLGL